MNAIYNFVELPDTIDNTFAENYELAFVNHLYSRISASIRQTLTELHLDGYSDKWYIDTKIQAVMELLNLFILYNKYDITVSNFRDWVKEHDLTQTIKNFECDNIYVYNLLDSAIKQLNN